MKKTEVTVGVCIKNCESTIEESFGSILIQDYPHELCKIIVVDGNSEDKTIPIIKNLLSRTDIRFCILSDGGKGLSKARSIVVENASGKYILWVDGDIVLPTNHISEQVKFMEQNTRIGIVRGVVRGKMGASKGESLCALLETLSCSAHVKTNVRTKATPALLGTAGSTFRLKALKQVGNFDTNLRGAGEDVEIAFRMKSAGWLLSINQEITHINRDRWKDLWAEHSWWGYGGHYVGHKFAGSVSFWPKLPPVAFASGIMHAFRVYQKTRLKACFLLPVYYVFTGMAWLDGFVNGHIDDYHPRS